jgi:pimeloyl-ACP methyl ester carboxylesterase
VLLNLIMNAIEAMDSVTDRARLIRITSDFLPKYLGVLLTIEDFGPGIDQKNIERIFEPFYTTKSQGMGMGLSICTAVRLLLRPSESIANAQDVAALKSFVAAQVPRYREIATPTVILAGTADDTVSSQIHAHALAAILPNARLVVLDGAGHMPHHTHTDAVVAAIDSFPAPLASDATR